MVNFAEICACGSSKTHKLPFSTIERNFNTTIEELKIKLKIAEKEKILIKKDAETETAELKETNFDLKVKLKSVNEEKTQMERVIADLKHDKECLEKENSELEGAKNNWQRQKESFSTFAKSFLSPKSREKLAPQKEESVCVICRVQKPTHVINPCGHLCLCSNDSCNAVVAVCPLCRKAVESTTRVYHA